MSRQKNDFYPTPTEATKLLLDVEKFNTDVWECACGNGMISKALEKHGINCISTDLYDYNFGKAGVDFLKEEKALAKSVCTNPPFKLALDFLNKCIDLEIEKTCMFLRLAFLESIKRKEFFVKHPPVRIWVVSKRLTLWRGDETKPKNRSGITPYAWFVWEKGHKGKPELWWL